MRQETCQEPILALDNVAKNFGGLRVVDNLSFSVRRGCCAACSTGATRSQNRRAPQ